MQPWENRSAVSGEPLRKASFKFKGVHLGAVIASPGLACWLNLRLAPTHRAKSRVAQDLVTK